MKHWELRPELNCLVIFAWQFFNAGMVKFDEINRGVMVRVNAHTNLFLSEPLVWLQPTIH